MSNAFLTRMPVGIPGDVTRKALSKVEPSYMNASLPVLAYGVPVKLASEKAVPVAENDAATVVYGFAVRPYPIQPTINSGLGAGVPNLDQPLDILRSGYINVKNNNGTPTKGGIVYVRVKNGTTTKPIGGIEAEADGVDVVAIADCTFMGSADANGNTEVAYKI